MAFFLLVPLTVYPQQIPEGCGRIPFKKHVRLPKEQIRSSVCGPRTTFIPRSPGSNTARRIAGWYEYLPGCDDRVWGNLSLTVEYAQSFKSERIAQYLFGSTCLHFSGSQVPNRSTRDLLADNFGLPTTFVGTVCFKPKIKNVIVDLMFHIGLDEWHEGLYFKTYFPIVNARWDIGLHCNEINNQSRTTLPTFPPCYMDTATSPAVQNIREALSGTATFGNEAVPIMFGEFACDHVHKTGIGDIEMILGWNTLLTPTAHAGPYIITVVPTSNKPNGTVVFEPLLGNGHLWELGAGASAHYTFFQRGCHTAGLYFEGHVTHQFKDFQVRSFDLKKHGPLSRYLLLKEFDENNQYNNNLVNTIDFATRSARVGGSFKVDASLKLAYFHGGLGFDIGYNIYARSRESLCIDRFLFPSDFNNDRLGIKGTEGVCARVFNTNTNTLTNDTVPLNSTQSNATIRQPGTVDNPQPITDLAPGLVAITWDSPLDRTQLKQAFNSNPPVLISVNELSRRSGAVPAQLTHKIFAHLSYVALDCCWEPQFGFGAEAEFDGRSKFLSSLNQWGIWVKGTLSY